MSAGLHRTGPLANPRQSFKTPSALALNRSRPKLQPTGAHVWAFLHREGPNLENGEDTLRRAGRGQPSRRGAQAGAASPAPGRAGSGLRARPPPGLLASPRATARPLRRPARTDSYGGSSRGHQRPAPGTGPSAPRAPGRSPGGAGAALCGLEPAAEGGRAAQGTREEAPAPRAGPAFCHTDLWSPPCLGCGPRSSGRLTGRRRPRPPPPPATASFPFAAATAGAHAGPAPPSPGTEAGEGRAGAAQDPALVAGRRCAAACPRRGAAGRRAGPGCEPLRARRRRADGGAAARGRERRVGRGDAQASGGGVREPGRGAVRRGAGEGDSGSVVSCSHPEPRATILGKTRISRPRRKPGRLAGRAEYPGRQRACRGRRASTQRAGRGRAAGGRRRARPRPPRRPRPPPARRRRPRGGRWEGEVTRGPAEARQGLPPSWGRAEGAAPPWRPRRLRPGGKNGVPCGESPGVPTSAGESPGPPNRGTCRMLDAPSAVGDRKY